MLEMTRPQTPKSRLQRYRRTQKGKQNGYKNRVSWIEKGYKLPVPFFLVAVGLQQRKSRGLTDKQGCEI